MFCVGCFDQLHTVELQNEILECPTDQASSISSKANMAHHLSLYSTTTTYYFCNLTFSLCSGVRRSMQIGHCTHLPICSCFEWVPARHLYVVLYSSRALLPYAEIEESHFGTDAFLFTGVTGLLFAPLSLISALCSLLPYNGACNIALLCDALCRCHTRKDPLRIPWGSP